MKGQNVPKIGLPIYIYIYMVSGKNPMRKKSHVGKNPMRKKSQRKKSHEDKIPEDKIPSGKYPM